MARRGDSQEVNPRRALCPLEIPLRQVAQSGNSIKIA